MLILASSSPRRRELLETLGYRLEVRPTDVDESPHVGEPLADTLTRVALLKAESARGEDPDSQAAFLPIVAADTMVVLDGERLGKPADPDHARSMLRQLSGRTHQVSTGMAIVFGARHVLRVVTSVVHFRDLTPDAIDAYVETGEPLDKAGGYGIQARGAALVRTVEGSYSNVVGLPVDELEQILAELHVQQF